ncbi:hypothetical protein Patl1_30484 [Pistacia atlantica]|uniref:Uncharacterized protein n=1 Tax=Pistacia atlantica TaxID=434234 RepID=A0ACC1AE41_9ROSI|nr:hypothetical protein Patl1_30484 [Pistacia atlantica]
MVSFPPISVSVHRAELSQRLLPVGCCDENLSSLVPLHSAISAACLVSKLPSEASASIQEISQFIAFICDLIGNYRRTILGKGLC